MKYCKKCTMPDTRPGITFDSEGVCSACRHYEARKHVTGKHDGRNLKQCAINTVA